jgi:predicted nucleic acid-binding protein
MIVVSNSTPLIHLSAMGKLDLLLQLFGEIVIANEVYEEVVLKGADQPGASEVQSATWIKRRAIANKLACAILQNSLGAGESATIILALELNADLTILDDRPARLQAQTRSIKITGTVGILLMAAERGLVHFQQTLDALLATGFRLSTAEYQRVINLWKAEQV